MASLWVNLIDTCCGCWLKARDSSIQLPNWQFLAGFVAQAVIFWAICHIVDSGNSAISPQAALWPNLTAHYANLLGLKCFVCVLFVWLHCFLAYILRRAMINIWGRDSVIYKKKIGIHLLKLPISHNIYELSQKYKYNKYIWPKECNSNHSW